MAKAEYEGVAGVARKVKSQNLGAGGVARKVTKGFLGVNGVARQFFAAVPTWKKYKTNVAYTLGCDVTTDSNAEKCWSGNANDQYFSSHITREYGSWPYFLEVVNGKANPSAVVSLDQSTGKVYWTNPGGYKTHSESSGGWSPTLRRRESDRWGEEDSVAFFHTYGPTGSSKYAEEHYVTWNTYMHDDSEYPTYQITLAWACVSPGTQMDDLYATVLYYTTPRAQLYHFYPKASYSRGDYIGEVTSESEGAYPANGRHTDGYWYVRQ